MAFLSADQLAAMGFAALGANVLISDKASIYGAAKMSLGDNIRIDDFAVLSGRVVIGRNVHISIFCNVAGAREGVTFEDFATLAPGCHVIAETDDYTGLAMTSATIPPEFRAVTHAPARLCRHAILGTGCVVLPGVTVAEGCAVGAMSLVNRSTEPWGMYVGVPARRVKDRKRDLLEMERAYLSIPRTG